MPSNPKYLDDLVGDPSGSDQVAVTLWSSGAHGRVVRVMVNPSVYDGVPSFVRSIILRHEITHVAQDALPQSNIPGWLTEGVAEYVGYRPTGLPAAMVIGDLLNQVRTSGPPRRWPTDSTLALDNDDAQRRIAYQSGWAFCEMVASRYGEKRIVPFYVAVSRGQGSETARLDEAARKVLGTSEAQLLRQWQEWLRDAA
jgi:hypothetical protein